MRDTLDSEAVFTTFHLGVDEELSVLLEQFGVHFTSFCQNRTSMGSREIRSARENSPLRVIIGKTLEFLKKFCEHIHTQSRITGSSFYTVPAILILTYYSWELWKIRYRATSRRQLVYKNYTYLRDATDNGFSHPKI